MHAAATSKVENSAQGSSCKLKFVHGQMGKCAGLLKQSLLKAGSAKANGREPKTCLGQVLNFKLGSFNP